MIWYDLYGHVKIHMGKKNFWSRFPELISVIHLWRSQAWLCEAGSSDVDPDKGGPCHGSECSSALALCGALGEKEQISSEAGAEKFQGDQTTQKNTSLIELHPL